MWFFGIFKFFWYQWTRLYERKCESTEASKKYCCEHINDPSKQEQLPRESPAVLGLHIYRRFA